MNDIICSGLFVVGGLFMLLAGIGVARMPDLFTRMQATTKASTLGTGCLLAGAAVHFATLGVTTRAVLIVAFVFLTAPIAAHVIGLAAYIVGVPFWEETVTDELKGLKFPESPAKVRQRSKVRKEEGGPASELQQIVED